MIIDFGFPEITKNQGPFWTNNFNANQILKILDFITNVSQNEWESVYNEYHTRVAGYDFDNKQLVNLIKKKINKNSDILKSQITN